MAEVITERTDGVNSERVVERDTTGTTTVVDRGGSGAMGWIVGLAVLALVVIAALYFLNANRNDAARTDAVTGAASSVAQSVGSAAKDVGSAARDAATPSR